MDTEIKKQLILPIELAGLRVDQALSQLLPEYSRSRITQWLRSQQITLDGETVRPKDKIKGGEQVSIQAVIEVVCESQAQAIDLTIIYEDDDLLIINKPAGLVVHPAAGHPQNTLVNALLHHHTALNRLPRAGIIHRLDKDTTGLLMVAKTLTAHTVLVSMMQQRQISREYIAIVQGAIISGSTIDAPIGRHPRQRVKMAVVSNGKPAMTHYRLIERFQRHSVVRVMLETGRTHQIRVHFAHIHHPIVGDPVYGGRLQLPKQCSPELAFALTNMKRQALHAQHLRLEHPKTGKKLEFTAPIADDLQLLIKCLQDNESKSKTMY